MPDDPIFNTGQQAAQQGAVEGQQATQQAATQQQAGTDAAAQQAQQADTARLAALEGQVTEVVGAVNQLTAAIAQAGSQNTQQAQAPADPVEPGDFMQKFVADGEGTIKEIANTVAQAAAAGGGQVNAQLVEATHKVLLQGVQRDTVDRYGQEAWDKIIAPELNSNIANLRQQAQQAGAIPAQLADHDTLQWLVQRIEGANRTALNEAETAETKRIEEAATQEAQTLMQGVPQAGVKLNRESPDNILENPDTKLFFNELAKAGAAPDPAEFAAFAKTDGTLNSFMAAQKQLNGSGQ